MHTDFSWLNATENSKRSFLRTFLLDIFYTSIIIINFPISLLYNVQCSLLLLYMYTCFYHLRRLRHIRRALSKESAATLVHAGALKMLDVKMTDQMTGHETAGHENAGHEIAGPENAGMK